MIGVSEANCRLLGCVRIRKQDVHMFSKSLLEEAATRLELGKSWTEESLYKEEFALPRESGSLHLAGTMVRRAMKAGNEEDWSEL